MAFLKSSIRVETRDNVGENLDVSLLEAAADNDWILYAPYTDKSLMRNRLTYDLSNDMSRWAVREVLRSNFEWRVSRYL
ncbi:MAG: CotH kinase family protein [Flavobacterium sp.]|nr:CotH kinase family protein [Flavobacterium sp.]